MIYAYRRYTPFYGGIVQGSARITVGRIGLILDKGNTMPAKRPAESPRARALREMILPCPNPGTTHCPRQSWHVLLRLLRAVLRLVRGKTGLRGRLPIYLPGADLTGARLSGADLEYGVFHRADLSGADLSGANVEHGDLTGARLRHANFAEAVLTDADLTGADLSGANFVAADLTGARLCNVNLSGAYMWGADFAGADLDGADLTRARTGGAYLADARNLTSEQFQSTIHSDTGSYRLPIFTGDQSRQRVRPG
jgi:hypothetical protein